MDGKGGYLVEYEHTVDFSVGRKSKEVAMNTMSCLPRWSVRLAAVCVSSLVLHSICSAATTVGTGETLVVTDANVASYADGIAFADATGVVEFETSSAPTMDITGAGTVKKTYSGAWTMSKQITGFTGDYILQGGGVVTVPNTRYLFGAESSTGGSLVIKPDNTLYVPNTTGWTIMGNRPVHIAGTGYNSMGAINTSYGYNTSGDFIKYLYLDDDATLWQEGPLFYIFFQGATLELNGHELTIAGNGDFQLLLGTKVSTNGVVRIRGKDASSNQKFSVRSTSASFSVDSPHADSPFVLDDNSTLRFFLDSQTHQRAVNRHVRVDGVNATMCVGGQTSQTSLDWTSTNLLAWVGPIALSKTTSSLSLYSNYLLTQMTVLGQMSGAGSVSVSSSNHGRVYIAATNNTYTGSTYFDNNSGTKSTEGFGSVLLAAPGSVPNYSSLTSNYGFVSLRMKNPEFEGESLWDAPSVLRLANEATWLNNAGIGLDTTYWTGDDECKFPWPIGIAAGRFIGGVGPGRVALTNIVTTAENRLNISNGGGTLRIVGDPGRQIHVGQVRVIEPAVDCKESVVVFDGCDLVYDEDSDFAANIEKPITTARVRQVPKIVLKDTRLVAGALTNDWSDAKRGAIIAGGFTGDAAVEILSGSVVTGRIIGAGRVYGGNGAFYQRGGSVTVLSRPSSADRGSYLGSSISSGHNHGYYELSGGDMTVCGTFAIGNVEPGYFAQTGGTFTLTNAIGSTATPTLSIGAGNGYGGALCVFGGTFNACAGHPTINGNYNGPRPFITVSAAGPTAYIDFGADYNWVNYNPTACTLFSMCSGGTIRTQGLHKENKTSTLIVNFNNGTFVPTQNGNGGAEDIFHTHRSLSVNYLPVDHVIVYSGGMTIDTDGKKGVYTYRPLEGATGGGVSGVTFGSPIVNIGGAPIVKIDGDGYGAVGVADFDSVSNVVRGVRILVPGVGYTYATAKLLYGRSDVGTFDCTISENANTGGFTKTGAGSFILYATNTWGGATSVAGGTLTAGCDWAVPPGTDLVLSGGGVMDFNGKTGEVASVTFKAGGGSIVNAEMVDAPSSVSMEIGIDDLIAGKAIALDGDVDLSNATITITGDVSALDKSDRRYAVVTATGNLTGDPEIVCPTLPYGWRFRVRKNSLVLSWSEGSIIMLH